MTVKKNIYFNPINNLSYLDHFIFNLKLIIFVLFSFPLIFIALILGEIIPFFGKWLPVIFHKLLLWLLSINVEYEGNYQRAKDCNFFVSNHLSYLDIPILGSIFPLRFVAKSEVQFWPVFGFLSKLARTIFIKNGKASFHVGAGIVADSNPDNEYEETLSKAAAMIEVLSDPTCRI